MTSALNSVQVVRLLADVDRRKVVAALILNDSPATTVDIVESTGLDLRSVVDATDRLLGGGMVDREGDYFTLNDHVFQQAARAEVPPKEVSEHDDQPAEVARVLDLAFKDGKLVQWPAKRSKRLIVLDYLCRQFDIGKRYKEPEINDMLRVFNDDVATMRRYLVDEQFLDRGAGEYWRCGGTI